MSVTNTYADNTAANSQYLLGLARQGLRKGTDGTTGPTGANGAPGSGQLAGTANAPDPAAATALSAMMASVSAIMPKVSDDDIEVLTETITAKMKDTVDKSENSKLTNDQEQQHQQLLAKEKKLKDAEQKIKDAAEAQKKSSIFDKIKLAFEYIGALLSMVAGIVAIATSPLTGPLGAVAGALLITSSVAMFTLAVDDTVAQATAKDGQPGMGMFGMMGRAIAKDEGKSDADADAIGQKTEMGFKISIMAIAIITGAVGSIINPEGALEDGEELAEGAMELEGGLQDGLEAEQGMTETEGAVADGDQAVTDGEEVASDGDEAVSDGEDASEADNEPSAYQKTIKDNYGTYKTKMAQVEFANDIGNATTDVGSQTLEYQASTDRSDAKKAQADAKAYEAVSKFLDGMIDMAIQNLKANGDRFNQVLDSISDAAKDRSDTMSHAKFRA